MQTALNPFPETFPDYIIVNACGKCLLPFWFTEVKLFTNQWQSKTLSQSVAGGVLT